ncbi:craniofacial development protein 2-like [Diadema setosum]|uniref:craniofacial development protein 2-like n=1 Tax=Diadema setosum TaxID=31175 RepID=UPI003B3BAE6C
MEERGINVLGVSETWWLNQGRFTTSIDYTLVYSGKESGKREHGVGIIMDKNTRSFVGFNPVRSRIITLTLHGTPFNITVVQIYVPTSTASDDDMENFYGQLQDTLDKISSKDLLAVAGDWNAKMGQSDFKSTVTGTFGLGQRNERGDRLEDFCQANDLIIGNTLFQQHPRRLWTWISPGDNVRNQIDYILGNLKECSNHRNISLISHVSKVLLKIINNRMTQKLNREIAEDR